MAAVVTKKSHDFLNVREKLVTWHLIQHLNLIQCASNIEVATVDQS